MQQATRSAVVHDQNHEVRGFSTNLESHATALEGIHRRRAPRAGKVFACAANHSSTTVASSHDESGFKDGRHDDHAPSLVEKVLRNIVGNIEDLLDDSAGVLQSIVLVLCIFVSGPWE